MSVLLVSLIAGIGTGCDETDDTQSAAPASLCDVELDQIQPDADRAPNTSGGVLQLVGRQFWAYATAEIPGGLTCDTTPTPYEEPTLLPEVSPAPFLETWDMSVRIGTRNAPILSAVEVDQPVWYPNLEGGWLVSNCLSCRLCLLCAGGGCGTCDTACQGCIQVLEVEVPQLSSIDGIQLESGDVQAPVTYYGSMSFSTTLTFDFTPACDDGEDNDGDGLEDLLDPDCISQSWTEADGCGDGVDNDGDGASDLSDPDCLAGSPEVAP